MPKVGALSLDGSVPVLAVPFAGPTDPVEIARAVAAGLDLAELRLDLRAGIDPGSAVAEVAKFVGVPTLATVRWKGEGGHFGGTEEERLALFTAVAPLVDALDIELAATAMRARVVDVAHAHGKAAVVSFHDLERTPDTARLRDVIAQGFDAGADIVKIATHAASDADVRTLAELLLTHPGQALVVIGMGPHGMKSRVLFPALGSLITFAAGATPTAPGQMPLADMVEALSRYYPRFAEKMRR